MKRILSIFALLSVVFPCYGSRVSVDIDKTINAPEQVDFHRGDAVSYPYALTKDSQKQTLSGATGIVWDIAAYTNPAIVWQSVTGTVDNATNGWLTVSLTSSNSTIPEGRYWGYVKALYSNAQSRVVVKQLVAVKYAPDDVEPAISEIGYYVRLSQLADYATMDWVAEYVSAHGGGSFSAYATTQALAEAVAPLASTQQLAEAVGSITVESIGALTAETDEVALAAVAGVQSNLTAHAGDTGNPHGVTAEQIGALTAETDIIALAAVAGVESNLTQLATALTNKLDKAGGSVSGFLAVGGERDPFGLVTDSTNVNVSLFITNGVIRMEGNTGAAVTMGTTLRPNSGSRASLWLSGGVAGTNSASADIYFGKGLSLTNGAINWAFSSRGYDSDPSYHDGTGRFALFQGAGATVDGRVVPRLSVFREGGMLIGDHLLPINQPIYSNALLTLSKPSSANAVLDIRAATNAGSGFSSVINLYSGQRFGRIQYGDSSRWMTFWVDGSASSLLSLNPTNAARIGGANYGLVVSGSVDAASYKLNGWEAITSSAVSNWNAALGWGGASGWSRHPATQTVDVAGNAISGVTRIQSADGPEIEFDGTTVNYSGAVAFEYIDGANVWGGRVSDDETSRISAALPTNNWNAAHGWGDHAAAGYIPYEIPGRSFSLASMYEDDVEPFGIVTNRTTFEQAENGGLYITSHRLGSSVNFVGDTLTVDGMKPVRGSTMKQISAARVLDEAWALAVSPGTSGGSFTGPWMAGWSFSGYKDSPAIWHATVTATNFNLATNAGGYAFTSPGDIIAMTNHTAWTISRLQYVVISNSYPVGSLNVTVDGEPAAYVHGGHMDGTLRELTLSTIAETGSVIRVEFNQLPSGENPVELKYIMARGLQNPVYYGRETDTHGQVVLADLPTLDRQIANKYYTDTTAAAALAAAVQETRFRTGPTDIQGEAWRWNARYDTVTETNQLKWKYGGETYWSVDGKGATVIPEIRSFSVSAGETATLRVWSYAGGATNLIPEVSTNLQTWTRLDANSIVSAEMVDDFTAQVVFTNAAATAMFIRLADVSGGAGRPVVYAHAPVHFAAGATFAAGTTNRYIAPGGVVTNTIFFDSASNMVVLAGASTALTISPSGKVGVGTTPSESFSLRAAASVFSAGFLRAGTYVLAGSYVEAGTHLKSGSGVVQLRDTAWLWSNGTNLFFSTSIGAGVTNQITSN